MQRRGKRRATDPGVAPSTPPRRAGWPVLGSWLFVLVAIGIVQIVRLQWFDATVFFAAALGVTALAIAPAPRRGIRRLPGRVLAGAGLAVGAVLCFLPRHSPAMQAAVIAIGVCAVGLAGAGVAVARPDAPAPFTRGIARLALAWALIVIVGCVWELIQFILGLVEPAATWFSLSDLLNPLVQGVPGRTLLIAAWLAGGVWLLRRGGRR